MADITDLGASVCQVSPSDQAGQIDNILSRLDAIEQAIRELQSQNISATQLSDIAASAGWIYDVTYMGTPGWTQTPAGTLIPPVGTSLSSLGLLMSDGNPFQGVTVDSDGVLQFGYTPSGQVSGAAIGGGSSPADYAHSYSFGGSFTDNTRGGMTVDTSGNPTSNGVGADIKITVVQAGLYFIGNNVSISWGASAGNVSVGLALTTRIMPSTDIMHGQQQQIGDDANASDQRMNVAVSGIYLLSAGAQIRSRATYTIITGAPSYENVLAYSLQIFRISA